MGETSATTSNSSLHLAIAAARTGRSHGIKNCGHSSGTEGGDSAASNPESPDPGARQEHSHDEGHSHEEGVPHKH